VSPPYTLTHPIPAPHLGGSEANARHVAKPAPWALRNAKGTAAVGRQRLGNKFALVEAQTAIERGAVCLGSAQGAHASIISGVTSQARFSRTVCALHISVDERTVAHTYTSLFTNLMEAVAVLRATTWSQRPGWKSLPVAAFNATFAHADPQAACGRAPSRSPRRGTPGCPVPL
jgi:hypothetical protein